MGGGGFMQHAVNTNRKDREQRSARRKKFKGENSEQLLQKDREANRLKFPDLSEEQIAEERKRIQIEFKKGRKWSRVLISAALVLVIIAISVLYAVTGGFEYW